MQITIPSLGRRTPPQRKIGFMQDAISKKNKWSFKILPPYLNKTQGTSSTKHKVFAHKRLSWVWPYLTNQAFNLIGLIETLMHVLCASLTDLPSWPDDRIFNQVTNAYTSGLILFFLLSDVHHVFFVLFDFNLFFSRILG